MPSGTVTPAGGGGGFSSQPYAYFEVDNTALASGALFTWTPINSVSYPGNVAAANAIFDFTDPTNPAAQANCRLAVSIEVKSNSAHAGKTYGCFIGWDADGVDDGPAMVGMPLDASFTVMTVASTRQLAAGQKIQAQLSHDVGGNLTVDFWALVQKLA